MGCVTPVFLTLRTGLFKFPALFWTEGTATTGEVEDISLRNYFQIMGNLVAYRKMREIAPRSLAVRACDSFFAHLNPGSCKCVLVA